MDYTDGSEELKRRRAKKMMLWFGIISLSMSFLGFTSAYIVSSTREDWLENFQIPQSFYISLVVIIVSSVTMHFALRNVKREKNKAGTFLLLTTFILGLIFYLVAVKRVRRDYRDIWI